MNLFLRLLAGHMLGDFVLQTGRIAEMKQVGWRGLFYHVILVVAATTLFLFTMPDFPIVLLVVGIAHLGIDSIRTFMVDPPRGFRLLYFAIDQTLHVLVLWGIALFFSPHPLNHGHPLHPHTLWEKVLLLFIVIVGLIYVVPIIEAFFMIDLGITIAESVPRITVRMRLLGAIERVAGFVLMQTPWIYLMPLVFLPHFIYRLQNSPSKTRKYCVARSMLSLLLTLIAGWLFKSA